MAKNLRNSEATGLQRVRGLFKVDENPLKRFSNTGQLVKPRLAQELPVQVGAL